MHHDAVIIGGGLVGLATALKLATGSPPRRVVVLEKEATLAAHQSGRNSGVLHSGLYYAPGSRKALLCTRGRSALLAFCQARGIAHDVCGKLVVARSGEEAARLATLHERGVANGLAGIQLLGSEQIPEREPAIRGVQALWIPQTGIVDFPAVARAYAEEIRQAGGEVRLAAPALAIHARADGVTVETPAGDVTASVLVNCAGLQSDRVARMAGLKPPLRIVPFRGEYHVFRPAFAGRVRNLVYPVPDPAFPFLGVHFTRMIHGGVECGPNAVLALKREGYTKTAFNARDAWEALAYRGMWHLMARHWRSGLGELWRSWSKAAFVRALRTLMPELQGDQLLPGGTGVRAQAVYPDGRLADDFVFARAPRQVHVLNAPSPAATASLAIGEEIAAEVALA